MKATNLTAEKLSIVLLVLIASISPGSFAAGPVADAQRIETLPIQGISLAMSPQQAFEHLKAAGYQAGSIDSFLSWDSDGIEFVRGTYGSRDGFWSVSFSRRGDRIVSINESFNAPGKQLDAEAEIGAVRRHLGLAEDTPQCQAPRPNSGSCSVQDAEDNIDAETSYFLQIMPGMRMAGAARVKEQSAN